MGFDEIIGPDPLNQPPTIPRRTLCLESWKTARTPPVLPPGPPPPPQPPYQTFSEFDRPKAFRNFCLLDDMTFGIDDPTPKTNGTGTATTIEREAQYSFAYLLRRPVNSNRSNIDVTVVTYSPGRWSRKATNLHTRARPSRETRSHWSLARPRRNRPFDKAHGSWTPRWNRLHKAFSTAWKTWLIPVQPQRTRLMFTSTVAFEQAQFSGRSSYPTALRMYSKKDRRPRWRRIR